MARERRDPSRDSRARRHACSRHASSRELSPLRVSTADWETRSPRERSVGGACAHWHYAVFENRTPGRVVVTPMRECRFATRPCAGATAVVVGRHPRDYIDPRGASFSAPFRRVLLRKPPGVRHDNARPLLPDGNVSYQPPGVRRAYSVAQL